MPTSGVTPSDVEVEWQLDALDLRPVERWLASAPTLPPAPSGAVQPTLAIVARPARRLADTYLDTEDWRIGRSGFSLRVRRRAGQGQVTLKDTSPAAAAGLRRRTEISEALSEGGLDALGGGGPVGRRLRALVGQRRLEPVLDIRTRRRPFDLRVAEEVVAEVALDETVIAVGDGGRPVRLRRVEVEVVPAWVETLAPLVDQLRRECGLQPATLSKFEAGLLAAGLRVPSPPDLGSTDMSSSPTIGELAFAVLRRNVGAMLAHEPGTRLGEDVEELHDMRVATRRLRAALAMFTVALPVRAQHLRAELGWLAGVLGGVRDLDVQIARLDEWTAEVPEEDRGSLAELAQLLAAERDAARESLLTALDSKRYERLVAALTVMLRQGPSRRSSAAMVPAVTAVPELVADRHLAAVKAARRARRSGAAPDFHRLRIRGKRLRYALEFVSELYGGQTGRYVRRVVKLQDALGLMQDAQVAAARLHALATSEDAKLSSTTIFTMGGIAERYREESLRLLERLPGKVAVLRGPEWHKLVAVMERRRIDHETSLQWPPVRRVADETAGTADVDDAHQGQGAATEPPTPDDTAGATAHDTAGATAHETAGATAHETAGATTGRTPAAAGEDPVGVGPGGSATPPSGDPRPHSRAADAPTRRSGSDVLRAVAPRHEPGTRTGS